MNFPFITLPSPNRKHQLSILPQLQQQFTLHLHVENLQTEQVWMVSVQDPITIKTQDESVLQLSPRSIYKHLLSKKKDKFQITSTGDLVIYFPILQNEMEPYLFKLAKEEPVTIGTQIRFRKLKQNFNHTLRFLQQKIERYQQRLRNIEKKVQEQVKPLQRAITQEEGDIDIVESYQQPYEYKITRQIVFLQNTSQKLDNRLKNIEEKYEQELKIVKNELNQRIIQIQANLLRMERMNDLFESSRQSSLQVKRTHKAAVLTNKGKPSQNEHAFYFSKLTLRKGTKTSIRFKSKTQGSWLFGICTQSSLSNHRIYQDKEAIFINCEGIIFIQRSTVINEEEDSIAQQRSEKNVIMTVDLQNWQITFKVEESQYSKCLHIPEELRGIEFHPTVLLGEQSQQAQISYQ